MRDAIATISYPNIFRDLEKQVKAVKVLKKVFKLWNLKLEQVKGSSPSGHQANKLPEQSA